MNSPNLLSDEERSRISALLTDWGLTSEQVADLLRYAVFPPGVTGAEAPESYVGIMVDPTHDPDLNRLFDWRAQASDQAFAEKWSTGGLTQRAVLSPHAAEAILAFDVGITSPIAVRRTYLVLASKQAKILAFLLNPGTSIWLVPQARAWREWAREGTGVAYDTFVAALPVGLVDEPPTALRRALEHVGYLSPRR